MPPKRKLKDAEHEDDAEKKPARSSARLKKTAEPVALAEEPAKKARQSKEPKVTAEATKNTPKESSNTTTTREPATPKKRGRKPKSETLVPELEDLKGAASKKKSGPGSSKPLSSKNSTKSSQPPIPQKYTLARSIQLFTKYADPSSPEVMGPEGLEQLCNDAGIAMDGALPLILSWQVGCKEMLTITIEEWQKTMEELKIDYLASLSLYLNDLQDLLILEKGPKKLPKPAHGDVEYYSHGRYKAYADDIQKAFTQLYTFCFSLPKSEQSRNIDMEIACAFWLVLLAPRYKIMSDIAEFINEKGTYKAVNKDLWSMVHEFCQTVSPNLQGYDADAAWPTMLDDFVEWKREKLQNSSSTA